MAYLEYIEHLGLLTKSDREQLKKQKELQKERNKQEAARASQTADNILAMDKERFNRKKRKQ